MKTIIKHFVYVPSYINSVVELKNWGAWSIMFLVNNFEYFNISVFEYFKETNHLQI